MLVSIGFLSAKKVVLRPVVVLQIGIDQECIMPKKAEEFEHERTTGKIKISKVGLLLFVLLTCMCTNHR